MNHVSITATDSPTGLRIRDEIESAQVHVLADELPVIESSPIDFAVPVDRTVRVATGGELRIPFWVDAFARDDDRAIIDGWGDDGEIDVEAPAYLELGGLDVKTYLYVDRGRLRATDQGDYVTIAASADEISLGARSMHDSPAARITTTAATTDLATVVSHLSSSLKTTSCERSFPTLRGHPPLLDLGDELHVPDDVSPPDTGVDIYVPPEPASVFAVTPLAWYTGARVHLDEPARLVAGGESWSLTARASIAQTATQYLKQCFTLDCIVRTEGLYRVPLHERDRVEADLPFDPADCYGQDLATQIDRYLAVDYETVEPAVPRWKQTMDLDPDPDYAAALPFAAYNLAAIRPASPSVAGDGGTRANTGEITDEPDWISLADTDAVEHIYVGGSTPTSGAVSRPRDLYSEADPTDSTLSVTVVVNDDTAGMTEETAVSDIYESREWYTLDVDVHEHMGVDELRDVIASETTLLHYIGHVDDQGFACHDGYLDVSGFDDVGIELGILNACQSLEQARALVDGGAVAALGSTNRIISEAASEYGIAAARLLSRGYSVAQMQYILQQTRMITPNRFVAVGDATSSIVHCEGAAPYLGHVEIENDEFELACESFCEREPVGLMNMRFDPSNRYIAQGTLNTWQLTADELSAGLSSDGFPVILGRRLFWSHKLSPEQIRNELD